MKRQQKKKGKPVSKRPGQLGRVLASQWAENIGSQGEGNGGD